MNGWMNEWEFIIRGAYCCCLLACLLVFCHCKSTILHTQHNIYVYEIMQHYTTCCWAKRGVTSADGKKFDSQTNIYMMFICVWYAHTHTHARRQKRKWMSSNDCVGKSFSTQKLFAHLNYKLDYESCDWISDVIVIMYSFRKMCVNTHAHARFCHGYDLCVHCDMDTKFHTLFHFLSLTFDFAHTHTCQKIIVLVNLSEKCYVLLVFCSVLFNSFLTIIFLLCFFYCLSVCVCCALRCRAYCVVRVLILMSICLNVRVCVCICV